MKTKFFKITLTAILAFAITFTFFACSSGNSIDGNNSGNGDDSTVNLYCDYGPVTEHGGGCFEMSNVYDCNTEWGQIVYACGDYSTVNLYCDYGPVTEYGGGCFEMSNAYDCNTEWGQIVYACGDYDTQPSSSSTLLSSSSRAQSSSSRMQSSSSVALQVVEYCDWGEPTEHEDGGCWAISNAENRETCILYGEIYINVPVSERGFGKRCAGGTLVPKPSSSSNATLSSSSELPSSSSVALSSSSHVHVWGNWVTTTSATCTTAGTERRTCIDDPSHFETRPIAQLSWGAWTTTTAATCTAAGTERRTCPGNASPAETRSIPRITPNPATEFCYNNSIVKKCAGNPQEFDPAKYECKNGKNGVYLKDNTTGYEAVLIGTQTWMAKNLNYNAEGSKCFRGNSTNCINHGRLYTWRMAMNLSTNCNSSSCAVQSRHQGICPSGWHIPSNAEWTTLINYVGGSSVAGTRLKINGTNNYGFAATFGGYADLIDYRNINNSGQWWTATQASATTAHRHAMTSSGNNVTSGPADKVMWYSVRCIKD